MNIAIVAPRRFAFQDLVCAELGMRFLDHPAATLLPEPGGGEDASITFRDGDESRTIEIQIKDEAATPTLARLAEMLSHFPPHCASGTLFERVLIDPGRSVLFVLSGRCSDEAADLRLSAAEWAGSSRAPGTPAVRRMAGPFLKAFTALAAGLNPTTSLARRRKQYLAALVRQLTEEDVAAVLGRVFVAEQETFGSVEIRTQERLRAIYRVPSDQLRDAIARLAKVIFEAKGVRDALPELRLTLQGLSPTSVSPSEYIRRGPEPELLQRLTGERVLLLAGPPRAGKSWTARYVAGHLQSQGYEVSQGTRVEVAERYLLDGTGVERAFLLDDPLGSRLAVPGASGELSALRALIDRLPANRRLVVAQGRDPLLATMRRSTLSSCQLDSHSWINLDILDPETAVVIWKEAAGRHSLTVWQIQTVEGLIRGRHELREPGALTFLAATFSDLPATAGPEQILLHARRDAVDVMADLSEVSIGLRPVLAGLALATEPLTPVARVELAHVIFGGDDYPTRSAADAVRIIVMGNAATRKAPPAPTYAQSPVLDATADSSLEVLLRRRFVTMPKVDLFNFAHPFYRAGAQALLGAPTPLLLNEVLAQAARALFGLSDATSRAAARALPWLGDAMADLPDGRDRVLALAEDGLDSLFPGTRDICLDYLVSQFGLLPLDRHAELYAWVRRVTLPLEDIIERDGIAWIETGETDAGVILRRMYAEVEIDEVRPYLDAIEAGSTFSLDFSLSRRIVIALGSEPGAMTLRVIERLLSVDEAAIRARAVRVWLSEPRVEDSTVLDRISLDRHPSVAVSVLRAISWDWDGLGDERRVELTALLKRLADSPAAALALFVDAVRYSRTEIFGAEPPWSVFAAVMPVAMRRLPDTLSFRDGRLLNVCRDAVPELGSRLVPLFQAWVERVERKAPDWLLPEEELRLIGPLLAATATAPDTRGDIIPRLLSIKSTAALIVHVADVIDGWPMLTDGEQNEVLSLLSQTRNDTLWLRAAALTRPLVPLDIQRVLLGREDVLSMPTALLLNSFEPNLFSACLQVYLGTPQPLWWLGTHHTQSAEWHAAANQVATLPSHPDFRVAFANALAVGNDDLVTTTVLDSEKQQLPVLFEFMLEYKTAHNGNWLTKSWNALLGRGEAAGHASTWLDRMAAAAPLFMDTLGDVKLWLGDTQYAGELFDRFKHEKLALLYAVTLEELRDSISSINAVEVDIPNDEAEGDDGDESIDLDVIVVNMKLILEKYPPILHGTYSRLYDALQCFDLENSDIAIEIRDARTSVINSMYPHVQEEGTLVGWVGPR